VLILRRHQHGRDLVPEASQSGSVCRREHSHENAVVESFFDLLKRERIPRRVYRSRDEARQDVFDYIEMFYNPKRKHVRNGMLLSPIEFEKATESLARGHQQNSGCSVFH
jgi:transposase InsO family protein